jgi:hypothetical protein
MQNKTTSFLAFSFAAAGLLAACGSPKPASTAAATQKPSPHDDDDEDDAAVVKDASKAAKSTDSGDATVDDATTQTASSASPTPTPVAPPAPGTNPAPGTDPVTAPGPTAPAAQPAAVAQIYRLYAAGDHLYSTSDAEGAPAYKLEGPAFLVLAQQLSDSVPLMRCRVPAGNRHFLSLDPHCEGWTVEGAMGFVLASQHPGSYQITRCFKAQDHLAVVDTADCTRIGYAVEGSLGFVPSPGYVHQ